MENHGNSIADIYLTEIKNLYENENWLSFIILFGTFNELAIRSYFNDFQTKLSILIINGLKDKKYNSELLKMGDDFRKIRNKYTHISLKNLMYSGLGLVDKNEKITLVDEMIIGENDHEKALFTHIKSDVDEIINIFDKYLFILKEENLLE